MQSWAVLQFPGSNSDWDAYRVFERLPNLQVTMHWHEIPIEPGQYEVLLVPGGFSFGDYLRAGAIAKLSPAMQNLEEVIASGCHVIGICNGFQILLEARLLPGTLIKNKTRSFISKKVDCVVQKDIFPWFTTEDLQKAISLPVAHGYGNYQISSLDRSEVEVALRYAEDINGSVDQIAGVYRKLGKGSVFGLMPHPERASLDFLPKKDGHLFWENARKALG